MDSTPKSSSAHRNIFMRYPFLRFLSSVKLAVPLMLALAIVVAVGTLYESRYNAQIASLHVYRSLWFQGLLGLLWVNILCATLSRLPFRKFHTGFVVTHIGLLTLLIGSLMTSLYGIDGNLRVVEGKQDRTVYTPDLILRVWPENGGEGAAPIFSRAIDRRLESAGGSELGLEDFSRATGMMIDRYLPFVRVSRMGGGAHSHGGGTQVAFNLESNFFNVNNTLSSEGQPSMQLGPALLRLVVGNPNGGQKQKKKTARAKSAAAVAKDPATPSLASPELWVKKGDAIQKKIPLAGATGKSFPVGDVKIEIVRLFKNGVVDQNKLVERGDGGSNPALEFRIESGGQKIRDITFSKFLGFTIQKAPVGGLQFELHVPGAEGASAPNDEQISGMGEGISEGPSEVTPSGTGNEIVFLASPSDPQSFKISLFKAGKVVLEKLAKVGETVVTPWMGMKITVTSITQGEGSPHAGEGSGPEVQPIELQPKSPLPPSALHARLFDQPNDEGFWLVENSEQTVQTSRGSFRVYYGMNNMQLPFSVQLDSFSKKDYPGTQTAMSFESVIRLDGAGEPLLVKMNEPLSRQGFVLYQSSYEMGSGMETASIFSVNQDPGRWVKYIGAIVLCLGIVIFTLMRSRWYLDRERAKKGIQHAT